MATCEMETIPMHRKRNNAFIIRMYRCVPQRPLSNGDSVLSDESDKGT